jgi:hypothetical protein
MKFFVLGKVKPATAEDLHCGTNAVKAPGFSTGPAVRCPECNRFLTMLRWLPPYRIEIETFGTIYSDIADVGEVMIVSERFAKSFECSGLKGLTGFEPVEVVRVTHRGGKPGQPLPRYFKTSVTYSATTVDQAASGYIWTDESKVCATCLFDRLKRFDRIVIREEAWNGDDVFFPRGGTRLMVTERFRTFFEDNGLLGALFVPAEQECFDYFPWETASSSAVRQPQDER